MNEAQPNFNRPSLIADFFTVGALGGAAVGLAEFFLRRHLSRGPLLGEYTDVILQFFLFTGFYACFFGLLGLAAGVVFGRRRLFAARRPGCLAFYFLLVEVTLLYLGPRLNAALPPLDTPVSIAANVGLLLGAPLAAFVLFWLTGKRGMRQAAPTLGKKAWRLRWAAATWSLIGLAVTAIYLCLPPRRAPLTAGETAGPNVLFITVDTLRADHLPAYGYAHLRTPNLDALAARGTLFENAFSTCSWTLPSFGTLMTGRMPRALNLQFHDKRLHPGVPTLPGVMSRNGRAAVGVSSNAFFSATYGFDSGFQRFVNVYDRDRRPGLAGIYLHDLLRRVGSMLDDAPNVNALAFEQLADLRDKPFFLWVHYMDPHKPYGGPWPKTLPEYDRGYRGPITYVYYEDQPVDMNGRRLDEADVRHVRALYDSDIARFDHYLGELLSRLAEGFLENTVIVVASDHGEEFLEHGFWGHGKNLYVEQTHVPLILAGPGVPAGKRVAARVSLLDLPATVCQLAGAQAPDSFTGLSLTPLFAGGPDRDALAEVDYGRHWVSLRTGPGPGRVLIWRVDKGETYFYDRALDLREARDLAPGDPGAAEAFFAVMKEYLARDDRLAAELPAADQAEVPEHLREQLRALGNL